MFRVNHLNTIFRVDSERYLSGGPPWHHHFLEGACNHIREGLRKDLIFKKLLAHPQGDFQLDRWDAQLASLLGHGAQVASPETIKEGLRLTEGFVVFIFREGRED